MLTGENQEQNRGNRDNRDNRVQLHYRDSMQTASYCFVFVKYDLNKRKLSILTPPPPPPTLSKWTPRRQFYRRRRLLREMPPLPTPLSNTVIPTPHSPPSKPPSSQWSNWPPQCRRSALIGHLPRRVWDPDPFFFAWSGSGSGFQISLDPDPILYFLCIRIRFQPPEQKKRVQKGL